MSLEEIIPDKMDRSTGRLPSAPPKCGNANGTDNGAPNTKFPSKNRRRGGPQSGSRPTSDYQATNRKTPIKYTDKRPRSRGYLNERQREEVTEGLRAEHGSVLRMGSKKTNLNHLLNFSVSHGDAESYDNRYGYHSSNYRGGKNRRWTKRTVKYNKEQFLQANCQFVVKDSGDYTVNSVDPDILVDWDLIEQVKIFGNQVPSCPICLYPPVAAKMTRCGHIYCWSCMLHYLSLSDKKTWRKCPICYEAVVQSQMKSVVALETRTYKVGDEITMSLMKREKGITYTVPVGQWTPRESKPHYVDDEVDLCFSKLLVASVEQVGWIVDREKAELDTQMIEHKGTLEGSYVQAALDLLKERQLSINLSKAAVESVNEKLEAIGQKIQSKGTEYTTGSTYALLGKDLVEYSSAFSDEESVCEDTSAASLPEVQSAPNLQGMLRSASESSDDHESPRPGSAANTSIQKTTADAPQTGLISVKKGDGEKVEVTVDEVAEDLCLPESEAGAATGPVRTEDGGTRTSDAFYFFQASDGQHIYLHSVNARCLVREYGSLEHCPPVVTATILEMEGISMNQELRSRLRYLSHLPLTCEFKVAELALKSPTVSKETLVAFADDIEKRKRLRNRKKRDETRQLKRMQDTECRKYEHCPEMRAFVSQDYFPENKTTITKSDMPSLLAGGGPNPTTTTAASAVPVGVSAGRGSSEASPDFTPVGSPAWSDVATGGGELPGHEADDGGQAGLSFAQMLRAGKAKAISVPKTSESSTGTGAKSLGSDSENEDRVPVPLYQESFGDAIFTALAKYNKTGEDTEQPAEQNATGGGKKKKKKQKKLLFVNTMARGK